MRGLDPQARLGQKVAGRYRVVSELSRGGMGAVFLAVQEPLEREIALKIMLPGAAADQALRRRFIQEAQALSRVPHRNIVTIFDFGEVEDGALFIAMELVAGQNLRELLERGGAVDWRSTLQMSLGATRALVTAHAAGITHRDLKPDNIMLVGGRWQADDVKLLDFGLARTLDAPSDQLTQVNVIPGTPHYIAPERVASRVDDPRSDLYALGAIWFELLTGQLPFRGETVAAILLAHVQQEVPLVSRAAPGLGVPDEVDQIVARLLAKQPDQRWASARELLDDLEVVAERLLAQGGAKARPGPRPLSSGALPRPPAAASRWTSSTANRAEPPPAAPKVKVEAAPAPRAPSPPAGPTSTEVRVGGEALSIEHQLDAAARRLTLAAVFRGRLLRQVELEVPALPADRLAAWVDTARSDFAAGLKVLLARSPPPAAAAPAPAEAAESRLFFFALEAWLGGDKQTALRTVENLRQALPDDARLANTHKKLLLDLGS